MITFPLLALMALQRPTVDVSRLRATVEKLVAFQTRNTNSTTVNDASAWIAGEFGKIPGIQVVIMHYPVAKADRVPIAIDAPLVFAVLPGKTDRRIIISSHLDSINLQADPFTAPAPGADDDASGVALTLECARIMATQPHQNTLVFATFSGEEQGLLGSKVLAQKAKDENWKIEAVLNNDIVGASGNSQGQVNSKMVRMFFDPTGPTNSRELARFSEWINRQRTGFKIKLVFRSDRYMRGGDHLSFSELGYPAVRFTEVYEDFTRQHNANDLPKYIDYTYLANVTRANLRTAGMLSNAEEPPTDVHLGKALSQDTVITWHGTSKSYVIYSRDSGSPVWQTANTVGFVNSITVQGKNKDDYVFAVGVPGGIPVIAK